MTQTTIKQVQCIQQIITSTTQPGIPVRLITQGCHLTPAAASLPSATAAALGMSQMALMRVALAESPGLRWGSLDVSPHSPVLNEQSASGMMAPLPGDATAPRLQDDRIMQLAESRLAEDISTPEAVYGQLLAGGSRVMPKMVQQEHPVSAQEGALDPEARIDASAGEVTAGNTIITGGLGAVGSLIANWLFIQVDSCPRACLKLQNCSFFPVLTWLGLPWGSELVPGCRCHRGFP